MPGLFFFVYWSHGGGTFDYGDVEMGLVQFSACSSRIALRHFAC
jgi:hypothetical protein